MAVAAAAEWAHKHWIWLSNDQGNQQTVIQLLEDYLAHNISVGAVNIDSGTGKPAIYKPFVPCCRQRQALDARMHGQSGRRASTTSSSTPPNSLTPRVRACLRPTARPAGRTHALGASPASLPQL